MAKKPKNPLKDENSNNSSDWNEQNSSHFKTLFGEINEQNSSNSLFSENNPFRRKPKSELGFGATDVKNEGTVADSELAGSSEKKRTKDRGKRAVSDVDEELGEESKKLKRVELGGAENTEDLGNDEIGGFGVESGKKKKKRKRDEVEAEYEAKRFGVTNEENKEGAQLVGGKRKKIDNSEELMVSKEGFDDESKLLRTVFVGNLPLKVKKKELVKEFEKFGEVESIRIRSVPIVDSKIPRKGAVIQKRINESRDSVHAYIVFKTEESAQASLAHNMAVVGGNHIRVDRACPPRKKLKGDVSPLYDNKRTVFVGNLPFDVKDEEIYQLFSGIKNASIEAIRVIRDPGTSLGKGIAYVLFKTEDAANSIATKRNLKLRDRFLRLSRSKSSNTSTPLKRKNPSSQEPNNNHPSKKFAINSTTTTDTGNYNFTPKTKETPSYQGVRASKSGSQKKVSSHKKFSSSEKPKYEHTLEQKSVNTAKRPAVAARKEKARKEAARKEKAGQYDSNQGGKKRKFGNRTPENGGQKKKARKFK